MKSKQSFSVMLETIDKRSQGFFLNANDVIGLPFGLFLKNTKRLRLSFIVIVYAFHSDFQFHKPQQVELGEIHFAPLAKIISS